MAARGKGKGTQERGAKRNAATPGSEGKSANAATGALTRVQARAQGAPLQLPWLPAGSTSRPGPHSQQETHSPAADGAGTTGTGRQQHEPRPAAPHRAGDRVQHLAGSAAQHAAGQAQSRGERGTPQHPTTAAPNEQYQLQPECQQPTDPTKIQAQQGQSKCPVPTTTPPVDQEHLPKAQGKANGDGNAAPMTGYEGGEEADVGAPAPQQQPERRGQWGLPGEHREAARTEEAAEDTAAVAAAGTTEAEAGLPQPTPTQAVEEPPLGAQTNVATTEAPALTPTSVVEAAAPHPDQTTQPTPPAETAAGVPWRTRTAAVTRRPETAAREAARAATGMPEAESATPERAMERLTAGSQIGISPSTEGGGGDKSALGDRTEQMAPGKNRRPLWPQPHQRRLGAGLEPARPGPLVRWSLQQAPPHSAHDEEADASPSSGRCRAGATLVADEEQEPIAEEEDNVEDGGNKREPGPRQRRQRAGTSRQQALQEQTNNVRQVKGRKTRRPGRQEVAGGEDGPVGED
ncbi:unnamed protein product [Closterium sp. Yama58-4]|nr:unnamed protein product [Closterium sp. Yama58-4]